MLIDSLANHLAPWAISILHYKVLSSSSMRISLSIFPTFFVEQARSIFGLTQVLSNISLSLELFNWLIFSNFHLFYQVTAIAAWLYDIDFVGCRQSYRAGPQDHCILWIIGYSYTHSSLWSYLFIRLALRFGLYCFKAGDITRRVRSPLVPFILASI